MDHPSHPPVRGMDDTGVPDRLCDKSIDSATDSKSKTCPVRPMFLGETLENTLYLCWLYMRLGSTGCLFAMATVIILTAIYRVATALTGRSRRESEATTNAVSNMSNQGCPRGTSQVQTELGSRRRGN